jgi:Transposase IS116/IS110/IS902 family
MPRLKRLPRSIRCGDCQDGAEVAAGQATFRSLIALLCTIRAVSDLAARTILAEIGTDMARFPTAGHLLSRAGLCPGQNESAGKRKSSRMRKGSWLKALLVQCTFAAARKKDSYYKAQFNRLRGRHGAKKGARRSTLIHSRLLSLQLAVTAIGRVWIAALLLPNHCHTILFFLPSILAVLVD